MRLADLTRDICTAITGAETEVSALTADSRAVVSGTLFAALPGAKVDGRRFIPQAIAAGATAILIPDGSDASAIPDGIAVISAANPRHVFALMAARLYGPQPETVVAVTGTNGKTSTAVFTRQLWTALGIPAASMGTLGVSGPTFSVPGNLTTPDPVALHRLLSDASASGVTHLAMEASSHGLDQHRLDGVQVKAAAFTNLTRDHLDYHGTVEAYLAAKRRLFTEVLAPAGTAVLNADVPEYAELAAAALAAGRKVLSYGLRGADLHLVARHPHGEGQTLDLSVLGTAATVSLPLAGTFQADNALAALGLVIAAGADPVAATAALETLSVVPGRLEKAATKANGAPIYVDYAHTPDALETVLGALRPHTQNRLICVFGCGGDRDRGKRPIMAEIAFRLSDIAIVTDDNPRTEDAATIRRDVLAGAPAATEIGDRRTAIAEAVRLAQSGDVVLLAGKGHESGQTIGSTVLPFDDREEARKALAQQETDQP